VQNVIGSIVVLVFLVCLFLIFRAMVLWYWRVNETVMLLKSIDEKLCRLAPTREPFV
jgi:hypothetical protein